MYIYKHQSNLSYEKLSNKPILVYDRYDNWFVKLQNKYDVLMFKKIMSSIVRYDNKYIDPYCCALHAIRVVDRDISFNQAIDRIIAHESNFLYYEEIV